MTQLLQRITRLFSGSSFTSELENYIIRRRPTSVAEIERLQKEYFSKKGYCGEICI